MSNLKAHAGVSDSFFIPDYLAEAGRSQGLTYSWACVVEAYNVLVRRGTEGEEGDSQNQGDVQGSVKQAHLMVRTLLETLPRNKLENKLETFIWTSGDPFSLDNWTLLCKNQMQLTSIEIGPLDRPFTSIITQLPNIMGAFSRVSSLSLFATSLDVLQAFQIALQAHPKVKELVLISKWASRDELFADFKDTSIRPGLIFRTIFSHMMPFSECTLIEATKITIKNIELRYADRFLMKAVAFKALEYLSVCACMAPEGLFAQLSQEQQLPSRLKSLRWVHKYTIASHTLDALERLLEQVPALEYLHIELDNAHRLPESKAISHFGSSLRSLLVQGYDSESMLLKYKCYEIEQICTECTGLRQLSVAFPQMYLSEPYPWSTWEASLESTRKLPNLVTLNIQNWPQTVVSLESCDIGSESMSVYENQLQRVAQNILEADDAHAKTQGWGLGHRSMLAVIAFGANGESSYGDPQDEIMLDQILFTRGAMTDALGRTSMLAVITLWQDLKYIEPESDIINRS